MIGAYLHKTGVNEATEPQKEKFRKDAAKSFIEQRSRDGLVAYLLSINPDLTIDSDGSVSSEELQKKVVDVITKKDSYLGMEVMNEVKTLTGVDQVHFFKHAFQGKELVLTRHTAAMNTEARCSKELGCLHDRKVLHLVHTHNFRPTTQKKLDELGDPDHFKVVHFR